MNILYTVIILPLELLLEFFFTFAYKSFYNFGLAIVGVSLAVSVLTLPLYHIAEKIQQHERDTRFRLSGGIKRIKEAFTGDEQYMMLSVFYRQNDYHPLYALKGSLSLLIQVPFFIAAYHFLSHLEILQGQPFLSISDLGSPDALIHIGGYSIHLLPLLMTAINIVSAAIYTKGFQLRDKIQLYAMALLFLVLLYQSPSALVLYWTLNNVFSLAKSIFYRMKRPLPILYVLTVVCASIGVIGILITHPAFSRAKQVIMVVAVVGIAAIPLLIKVFKSVYRLFIQEFADASGKKETVFGLSILLLFLLHGVLVPINLIGSSPIEFSFIGTVANPLSYVAHTAMVFFGLWVVWPFFIFRMTGKAVKANIATILGILSLVSVSNLFLFKGEYGVISTMLQFDNPSVLDPSLGQVFFPLLFAALIAIGFLILLKFNHAKMIETAMTILLVGVLVSASIGGIGVQKEWEEYSRNRQAVGEIDDAQKDIRPEFRLSRTGRNVVFLFLDRAMSSFFPTILESMPDLADQYEGFVYHPNTVSFGQHTLQGAPAMLGGYEYTPDAINARAEERLVDKHNEALLVLPRLFLDEGYSVTITDPPFSNFRWGADYSPFRQYPAMRVTQHSGKFAFRYQYEHQDVLRWDLSDESILIKKRLPAFSIFRTSFPVIRKLLYDKGQYFLNDTQQPTNYFINTYAQLYYLKELTEVVEAGNNYLNISNDTTHCPSFLQVPEYEPRSVLTDVSTPYDDKEDIQETDRMHYLVNVAALKRIGIWLDYLKEEGVYDNTKIIIVSDHGFELYSEPMKDLSDSRLKNAYVPLFITKDFDVRGDIRTDNTFMTNADAALFAVKDVIGNPVNPFTKNNLFDEAVKDVVNVYEAPWDPKEHSQNVFSLDLSRSYSIHDSIFIEENWSRLD